MDESLNSGIDGDVASLLAEVAALRAENAKLSAQLRIYERLVLAPIAEVDRDLRVKRFSFVPDGITAETLSNDPFALLPPEARAEFADALRQVFIDRQPLHMTLRVQPESGGSMIDFDIVAAPADDSPDPQSIYLLAQDVTEQKAVAQELATKRAHFQAIFDHATDMILLSGDDMRYIDVNPAAAATLGYTMEEMRSLSVADVFPPMEQATAQALWEAFIAAGTQEGEVQVRRKDGTMIDVDYRAVANILPGVHLSIMRDVSQRKQLETELARSQAFYQAIFDGVPLGLGIADLDGRPIAGNPAMLTMLGYSEAEFLAIPHASAFYADPEVGRQRIAGHEFFRRKETMVRRKDGTLFPARNSRARILLPDGVQALAVVEDVSDEVALRADLEFGSQLLANIQDAIVAVDRERCVVYWNASAETLFGVAARDILGRRIDEQLTWRNTAGDGDPSLLDVLAATGRWEGDLKVFLPDGGERVTRTSVSIYRDANGNELGWIAVAYDATEERTLQADYRRQAQILDSVMEAVIVTDLEFTIIDWNASAKAMYGWRADEVIGQGADTVLQTQHADRDAVVAEFRKKGRWVNEVAQRHKDGRWLWVLSSVSYVYDADGVPVGVVAVNRDVTRRHNAENELRATQHDLRRLLRRLERSEATQRKELARNLHDDLGATLTAVRLDIDWLDAHLRGIAPPDVITKLERMAGLATAAIRTTQAVTSDLRPSLLDDLGLVAALESLTETWSTAAAIPVDLHLDVALEERLDPELAMDLYRIAQEALTNVARHAAATQVTLELAEEDGQVVLLVADNGRGVEIDRQIDPDALGLIGMRERADAWDGTMVLTGAPGRGSTLTVRIPLDAALAAGDASLEKIDRQEGKP